MTSREGWWLSAARGPTSYRPRCRHFISLMNMLWGSTLLLCNKRKNVYPTDRPRFATFCEKLSDFSVLLKLIVILPNAHLIFRAPFNLTPDLTLTCRRCVAKQQISLATHRNERLGYEGPSGSLTHARWRICAARRPRSRVSLHAQPYQCFTDTFFFSPPQLSWRHAQLFFSPTKLLVHV